MQVNQQSAPMFIAAFSYPLCLPQMFRLIWANPQYFHTIHVVLSFCHTHAPAPTLCGELQETRNAPCHRLCWAAICQALPHNVQPWIRAHGLKYKEEKNLFFFIVMKEFMCSASHTRSKVAHILKSRTVKSHTNKKKRKRTLVISSHKLSNKKEKKHFFFNCSFLFHTLLSTSNFEFSWDLRCAFKVSSTLSLVKVWGFAAFRPNKGFQQM